MCPTAEGWATREGTPHVKRDGARHQHVTLYTSDVSLCAFAKKIKKKNVHVRSGPRVNNSREESTSRGETCMSKHYGHSAQMRNKPFCCRCRIIFRKYILYKLLFLVCFVLVIVCAHCALCGGVAPLFLREWRDDPQFISNEMRCMAEATAAYIFNPEWWCTRASAHTHTRNI